EACPFENKEATMSLLHSFYCWGSVGTILISTAFFALFGMDSWKWLAVVWALVPAVNIYNFATCPIVPIVDEGTGMGIRKLLKTPLFLVSIILMICAGASELSMAQWASAYAEAALKLSKSAGDLAGPCMFAITMGISRVIYGKYGEKIKLTGFMIGSGALCVIAYLLASLSGNPIVGLIGCIICGFSVGIMWPGTLSISSKKFPLGGTAMFALLAMAGDLGGSIGPAIVGRVAQNAGDNIRAGMGVGLIFPAVLVVMTVIISNVGRKKSV
ncbi:MAG: MFS transporter, partial [Lachnospiraceae bacterium]|nr:MFS transporter [Lachnospiraceae bacterium]